MKYCLVHLSSGTPKKLWLKGAKERVRQLSDGTELRFWSGLEVTSTGEERRRRAPDGRMMDETIHLIQSSEIKSLVEYHLCLHYGHLVRGPAETCLACQRAKQA